MAENKKKRRIREKKDTLLKWFILAETAHLSNEEFGAMVRNVMMEDDADGIRYEHLNGFILDTYKKTEEKWKKDFSEMIRKKPELISAYSTVIKQTSHSHEAFDNLKNYIANLNGEDGNESGEIQEDVVTSDEVEEQQAGEKKNTSEVINDIRKSLYRKEPFGPGHGIRALQFPDGEIIYAHYEKCNEANVITQEEFLEHIEMSDDKDLVKDIIYENNKQGWKPEEAEEGPF